MIIPELPDCTCPPSDAAHCDGCPRYRAILAIVDPLIIAGIARQPAYIAGRGRSDREDEQE